MEKTIKKLLVEVCNSEGVLENGVNLIESGLLDSLALINLLMALEEMGIILQPTQIDKSCFTSVENITELVEKAKNQ